MELYFKIKFIETIIGYCMLGAFILAVIIWLLLGCLCGRWEKRQQKKSEKFWKDKENENTERNN